MASHSPTPWDFRGVAFALMNLIRDAAQRLDATLNAEDPKRMGGLCLYGAWEGGRRGETWHEIAGVESEGDAMKLTFTHGPELLIYRPVELEIWKNSITIRAVERFVFRYGPGQEREVLPPATWPPSSVAIAFEFAI